MRFYLFLILVTNLSTIGLAQNQFGGCPEALINRSYLDEVSAIEVSDFRPNTEDQYDKRQGIDNRFAGVVPINFDFKNRSTRIVKLDGTTVNLIKIKTNGAGGQAILFEEVRLKGAVRIFVYNLDFSEVSGAYDGRSISLKGRLLTEFISGNELIIEVVTPPGSDYDFIINNVYARYDFDVENEAMMETGYGTAAQCHINVNCPTSEPYANAQKGVVRILAIFEEGAGWCSGSLINNTSQDTTPYLLTAFHCQSGFTPMYDVWRFDFTYESHACDIDVPPVFGSMTGAIQRAGREESDFLLLELEQDMLPAADAVLNGWNRTDGYTPSDVAMIHQPSGDIKKISIDEDPIEIYDSFITWDNGLTTPPNHHFKLHLDQGTSQNGSSGSPLLDLENRIIGQLHGGFADTICDVNSLYFGRIHHSWNEGVNASERLSDWLDPGSSGAITLDALDISGQAFILTGTILTPLGIPMPNVEVHVSGDLNGFVLTDANGRYTITSLRPDGNYTVSPTKPALAGEAVTAIDLLQIKKHLLGLLTLTNYSFKAADVNISQSISGLDLLQIQKVILGVEQEFPSSTPWRFDPPSFFFNADGYNQEASFTGFKVGDVNFSAQP